MSFKDKLNQVTKSPEEALKALKEKEEREKDIKNRFVENQTEEIYNRIEAALLYTAENGQFKKRLFSKKKYIEVEVCIRSYGTYDKLLKSETQIVGGLYVHSEMYCSMTKEGMQVIQNVQKRASQNEIDCRFNIKMENLDKRDKVTKICECKEERQTMSYKYGNPSAYLRIHASISY